MRRTLRLLALVGALLAQEGHAAEIGFPTPDAPSEARVINDTNFTLDVLFLARNCTGTAGGVAHVCADATLTPFANLNFRYPSDSGPRPLARITIDAASQLTRDDLDDLVARGILSTADLAPNPIPSVATLAQLVPDLLKFLFEPLEISIESGGPDLLVYIASPEAVEAGLRNASRQNAGLPPISVPAPAALPLFATALIGFGWAARRRQPTAT